MPAGSPGTGPPCLGPEQYRALKQLLAKARRYGYLGPGPLDGQILRSLAFAAFANTCERAMDLGSGGGLPGLVLASAWPATTWYLVDSNRRRSEWLRSAVRSLGLERRCVVVCERAEVIGKSELRGAFDLVTARGFGPPSPTAECAAPMLRAGGELVASDPPQLGASRWPPEALATLGLVRTSTVTVATPAGPVTLSRMLATTACPSDYPRRVGIPFKRPLF